MGKVSPKDPTGRTVVLTGLRVSFGESLQEAQLPKKNKDPNARPTHGSNLIVNTKDEKNFESNQKAIISALKAAAREFNKPEDWYKRLMEDDPKQCSLRKGNKFKDANDQVYKGYEDNLILVTKGPKGGKERPQIRDRYKKIITDVSKINEIVYNGTLCDAVISFYGTDNGGTARLTCSVESIRSWQEGEKLGGGGIYVEDDDFEDLPDDDSFDNGPNAVSGEDDEESLV